MDIYRKLYVKVQIKITPRHGSPHSQFAKKLDYGPEIAQVGSAANRHIETTDLDGQSATLMYGHFLKG